MLFPSLLTTCLTPVMATTRYKGPLPEGVPILKTVEEGRQFQAANVNACMWPDNGGYYMKNPDGTVIAVASDEVCEYADRGEAEIAAMIASGELSDDETCHLGEGGGPCQNCINAQSEKGHSGP
jgi:hypothetical protein